MTHLTKIGLTGGIAAGKSTVLQYWSHKCGASTATIETDLLAHQSLAPGTPVWNEVVREFGREILNTDGSVNRQTLGGIVFADEQRRAVLNRIVHPAVRRLWTEAVAGLEKDGTCAQVVVCIPLLYEVDAAAEFDAVVAVGCSEQTQRARLAAKGLTETEAWARIGSQWPLPEKMDRADFVIWNDGLLRLLQQQADIVWATIKENYHGPSKN